MSEYMTIKEAAEFLKVTGQTLRNWDKLGKMKPYRHASSGSSNNLPPDNWIYIQEKDVRIGRLQVFNNWSPYLVADPARTVWIGLEYFVDEGDELWRSADGALIERAAGELERIGFARRDDVLDGCVRRMPKAYPAYFGTYGRLGEVRRWVNGIPNLLCIGRNGMHRYNNQDHSMLTAMLAVDNIVAAREDDSNIWDVNLEMVYQEE